MHKNGKTAPSTEAVSNKAKSFPPNVPHPDRHEGNGDGGLVDFYLAPKHLSEWQQSQVEDAIITRNVRSLSGEDALEAILGARLEAASPHGHQYATNGVRRILKGKGHLSNGGWWVAGLDPLNNWELMEWGQFKPDHPRTDQDGKLIKYETPQGTEARAIFLDTGEPDYWPQVLDDPTEPIVIVEGAKKAGCLLSLGYAAVAIPGIWMAIRIKDQDGGKLAKPIILPELKPFAGQGREVVICFDQDFTPETRRNVARAIDATAETLTAAGCLIKLMTWGTHVGKGIDDVAAKQGADRVREIVEAATDWEPPCKQFTQIVAAHFYGGDWICAHGVLYEWMGTHYEERPDSLELRKISNFLDGLEVKTKKGRTFLYAKPGNAQTALDWVKQRCAVDPDSINPKGALNLKNGVLVIDWSGKLPTWKLAPHDSRKFKFTYAPTYSFDPDCDPTDCDRLLAALEDRERPIFLRTLAAALDLPEVRRRKGRLVKTLLLWGDGANGKDSLREAAAGLFGQQGLTSCGLQDFQQYDQGRKFPLAALEYSRINWSSENIGRIPIDKLETLKQVTTGDPLSVERKGQQEYLINPSCVLLFNINVLPNLKATGTAILSRFAILSFRKIFKQNADLSKGELEADPRFKYDPQWVNKVILPALLNKLLAALQDLIEHGIDYEPTKSTLEEVQQANSHLAQFCADTGLRYTPGASVEVSEIWSVLEQWYQDNGYLEVEVNPSNGKQKRVWSEPPTPGDRLVKGANQVQAAFLSMFSKCQRGTQPRLDNGAGKPLPIIKDLAFHPVQPPAHSTATPSSTPSSTPTYTQFEQVGVGTSSQDTARLPENLPTPTTPTKPSFGTQEFNSEIVATNGGGDPPLSDLPPADQEAGHDW